MKLFFDSEDANTYYTSSEGEGIINIPSKTIGKIARNLFHSNYKHFKVKNNRGSFLFTLEELLLIAEVNRMRKLNLSYKMIADILDLKNKNSQPKEDTSWADHLNDAIWRRF